MRARPALLILHLAAAGAAYAGAGCAAPPPPVSTTGATPLGPAESRAALPMAPIVTLQGEPTDLGQVARGRVALVSFWATWCEACTREMDALNRLATRTAGQPDALVIGVAVGEPRATVDAFVRRRGLGYAQLVDEEFRLADALGQRQVPATLVVDRAGRIVYRGDVLDGSGLDAFRRAILEPR